MFSKGSLLVVLLMAHSLRWACDLNLDVRVMCAPSKKTMPMLNSLVPHLLLYGWIGHRLKEHSNQMRI